MKTPIGILSNRCTLLSILLVIFLLVDPTNSSSISNINPTQQYPPGENPIVTSFPLFDSSNIPSHTTHSNGRRLSGAGDLPLNLVVFIQPGNATGGIPSTQQVVIRAIKSNGQFSRAGDTGMFLGEPKSAKQLLNHMICAIGINPPIVATLRQRNMTSDLDLWSLIEFDTPKAHFYHVGGETNGILEATFEGVFINELGNGYTLQLISRTAANFPTYFVESAPFNVVLGPVHRLSLYIQEGTATGGLPFRPQPQLAIVDRGNNICVWDQQTTIRVDLLYSPTRCENNECRTGQLVSTFGASDFNHTVYNGRATFLGLNFDVSGYPYKLRYTANGPTGVVTTESINITVGVGVAQELSIVRQASGTRGGIPFVQQPYLVLKDAGGNILVADSSSYCTVSISNNPSGGSLSSLPTFYHRNEELDLYTLVPHTVQLSLGTVTFRNVSLDLVGREYRLLYTVTSRTNYYQWTGTRAAFSTTFDVTHGNPTALVELTAAGTAWAGGAPFAQQPVIAILDGGGNIMTPDSVSTITAELLVSPTGFPLLGQKTFPVALGVLAFLDLKITKEAIGYILRFTTSAGSFHLDKSLDVIPSAEYMLMSAADRQSGDKMGSSCAADDITGLVAIGATDEDRPVDEVQTITTSSKAAELSSEVQYVTTSATIRPEIQSIRIWCNSGSSIARRSISSGPDGMTSFQLEWINPDDDKPRLSRHLASEMPGPMLASMLETDMAGLGEVVVSRDSSLGSTTNCLGSVDFRITFISRRNYVPLMKVKNMVYESQAQGGTYVVERKQLSTYLGGTFTLIMPVVQHEGHGAHCESIRVGVRVCDDPILQPLEVSRPLPWNITEIDLAYEIQRNLWYVHDRKKIDEPLNASMMSVPPMVSVTRSDADPERGFTWSVTFIATNTLYDPPNMIIDVSGMSGYKPKGVVQTVSNGVAPLAGTFRLMFRGRDHTWHGVATGLDTAIGGDQYMSLTSPAIPWNATATEMETALELMGAVQDVDVERSSEMSKGGGYTWTITFKTNLGTRAGWDSTAYSTPYGLRLDNVGNLQPLQVDTTRLAGTQRDVQVMYLYNTSTSPIWNDHKIGFDGESAGAVYIYKRDERRYEEELKIRSLHTDAFDKFGWSTALWRHTLAVGAPHAAYRGYYEKQSIVCSADDGAFTLSFLDHTTEPIPFNTTGMALKKILELLQPIVKVEVETWQNAVLQPLETTPICTNLTTDDNASRVIVVTFIAPDRGDVPAMEADVDHRSGILHPEQSNLVGWATLRRGGEYGHVEIKDDLVRGTDKLHGTKAVGTNTGVVYVFRRSRNAQTTQWEWHEEARLQPTIERAENESPLHSNGQRAGVQFGYSVAMAGPPLVDIENRISELSGIYTLVIGAPEDDVAGDGAGLVYVYKSELKCLNPCRAGTCCKRIWPLLQKINVRDMICGLSPYTKNAIPFKCGLDPIFGSLPAHRFGHTVSISSAADTIVIGELWHRATKQSLDLNIKMKSSQAYVLRVNVDSNNRLSYIPDQILTSWDRPLYAPDGDEGYDDYGASVDVEGDVLLVGAPSSFDVATSTLRSGAAYAYKRLDPEHSFEPELKMQPPQVVYNQKFGRGVRVSSTKLSYQALITAHEEFLGMFVLCFRAVTVVLYLLILSLILKD